MFNNNHVQLLTLAAQGGMIYLLLLLPFLLLLSFCI